MIKLGLSICAAAATAAAAAAAAAAAVAAADDDCNAATHSWKTKLDADYFWNGFVMPRASSFLAEKSISDEFLS